MILKLLHEGWDSQRECFFVACFHFVKALFEKIRGRTEHDVKQSYEFKVHPP